MSNTTILSAATWRRVIAAVIAAALIWVVLPAPAAQALTSQRVDLKVLLVANGGSQTAAFATLMDREGIPYTTVDLDAPGRPVINDAFLADSSTGRGYYQSIVLPDHWGTGLAAAELTAIHAYERSYGARQVDAYSYPGSPTGQNPVSYTGSLDGASATVTAEGLAGPFVYLNGPLSIDNFDPGVVEVYGYLAAASSSLPAGETFTPLVTATVGGNSGAIVGVYDHDFREELVITAAYNADQKWFQEIGHGIVTWMTRGLHLGYHRNYLNVQVDDVFLPDSRWSSTHNCTPGDTPSCIDATATDIRMIPGDVDRLVGWQNANDFTFDIVFNAQGSDSAILANGSDPLTDAFLANKEHFTWVNHTYTHTFLGCIQIAPATLNDTWRCAVPGDTGPYYDEDVAGIFETTSGGVRWLSQAKIFSEISLNQLWATTNSLPNFDPHALVTGEHSGLLNDPQQPIDNPMLAPALEAAGITHTASDASREPDSRAVQGGSTMTVPRHPMNIFYNAGTYGDEVDEYNWIYTSEANGGSGICEANPGTSTCITPLANGNGSEAQSSFLNYIVPIEVRNAYRFVISNDPRPFYAHQSNLAEDGILYPVVAGILDTYRASFNDTVSPIVTDDLVNIGELLNDTAAWTGVKNSATAYVDATGVHVSAPNGTPVPLTVPTGTTVHGATFGAYDGELSGWLTATGATTLVAETPLPMGGYVGHTAPDAPTAVGGTTGTTTGSVDLTWTAPAKDGNAPITGYEVRYSLDIATPSWTVVSPLGATPAATIGGLTENSNYVFQVRAVNAFGAGPWSASSAPVLALPIQHPVAGATVTSPAVQLGSDATITLTVDTTEGFAPSGTATLTINGNTYSTAVADNVAVFAVPSLAAGTFGYTVDYAGDLHIAPFSRVGELTVNPATPSIQGAVGTAPTPQTAGTYTVTLTVASGLPAPTGAVSVTLTNGPATQVVDGTLSGGSVVLTVPALAAGTWDASVAYAGDANYAATTAAGGQVVSQKTGPVSATGQVLEAPTPQTTGSYKVTITQPGGLAVPTGGVTLTLTHETLPDTVVADGTLSDGVATIDLPALAAGQWEVIISSTGDDYYLPVLIPGDSVTSSKVAPESVVGGATVAPTTTAGGSYAVTVTAPTGLATPGGTVTLTLTKGSATEEVHGELSGGTATISLPSLAAGTWDVAVAYSGDGNYSSTTTDGTAVTSAKSAVESVMGAVAIEPIATAVGAYTVTVAAATGLPIPTGDVTVTLTKDSATETIQGTLDNGTVTIEVPILELGTWEASVAYAGDDVYEATTVAGGALAAGKETVKSVVGQVTKAPTPQVAGTFKVTVTQPDGLGAPTGEVTVTLTNGTDTHVVTGTLASGVASLALPKLAAGTWATSVAYAGDDVYAATTVAGPSVTSVKAAVASVVATVTSKPTTTKNGSYAVTVKPPTGLAKPTGTITLTLTKGSVTKKITGTLQSTGAVKITIPKLGAGTWKVKVSYGGNANYLAKAIWGPSIVSSKTKVASVSTSVTKTPTTKAKGSYKVTVAAAKGLPKPTGKVTITLKKGKTTKKYTGTLKNGVVTITLPKLAKGTWYVTAKYAGSTTYLAKSWTGKSVVVRR